MLYKIPKYDPNNGLHKKIADLSRRAHELAKCIYAERKPDYCRGIDAEGSLRNVERELDLAVAQLFGLSEEDLREFERLMAILSGEELPSEEKRLRFLRSLRSQFSTRYYLLIPHLILR